MGKVNLPINNRVTLWFGPYIKHGMLPGLMATIDCSALQNKFNLFETLYLKLDF